jgi:hypothetical protein
MISANAKAVVKVMMIAIIQETNTHHPSSLLLPKILLFLKKIPIPTTALIKMVTEENKPIFAELLLELFCLSVLISYILF